MRTQSPDTHPAAERVQIAIMRGFTPARKFALECGINDMMTCASQAYRNGPHIIIKNLYGKQWAKRYAAFVAAHPAAVAMQKPDLSVAVLTVCSVLERRQIPYALSGGVACGIYGLPSTTDSIEIIIDYPRHVRLTSAHTRIGDAYLDVTHLKRVEIIQKPDMLRRSRQLNLIEDHQTISVISPEDLALLYLERFNATGRRDDALYNDLLGMLKVQAPVLDTAYLRRMAALSDLLGLVLKDAGIAA